MRDKLAVRIFLLYDAACWLYLTFYAMWILMAFGGWGELPSAPYGFAALFCFLNIAEGACRYMRDQEAERN